MADTTTTQPTEAQRLITRLMKKHGMRCEEIAYRMKVSLNSVVRWRRNVQPWPGHMQDLRALVKAADEGKLPAAL